ncbi:hypothetical protein [Sphingobacterium bovistauri]|uniref:Collagen triple helix repeat-containing protein n=1 Tax=Sphingobacterium bovistauri TaxID=2781959 RepID=A0ABS7Z2Y1_9SPHI|nr:hypothetical protein [Sphingobacterium bovistauri]MCA5004538.1 hypothetical protein [Sphingobacterium bovistauri]
MKRFRLLLLCMYIIIIYACTKEGVVGPQGEDGVAGSKIYNGNTMPSTSIGVAGDYYFDTSSSDFYGPKSIDGWGNPINLKGAIGATGSTGSVGATGADGKDGSKIIATTGSPSMSVGNVGDFYIDLSTSNLYGPKITSSWGTPVNLKGANGANGTKILNGTTIPDNELGAVGDYYFQTNTANLYGPKTGAGWGTPIRLIGATGENGSNGNNGTNGKTILNGTTVPVSTIGTIDDFYYRTNTGDFYGPKTALGWGVATNLKGTNGKDGAPGSQILSGTAAPDTSLGRIGDFYFRIATSDFYGPKTATSWGSPVRLKGATGSNGSNGAPGSKILNGSRSPVDTVGIAGDYYINISTGDLHGPKGTNSWGMPIMNLRSSESSTKVYYSPWYSGGLSGNSPINYIRIPSLALTSGVFNTGQVLVYEKYDNHGTQEIRLLGAEIYTGGRDAQVYFKFSIGYIDIQTKYGATLNGNEYRYIIIPGNTLDPDITHLQSFQRGVKIDYNIAKTLFNILD